MEYTGNYQCLQQPIKWTGTRQTVAGKFAEWEVARVEGNCLTKPIKKIAKFAIATFVKIAAIVSLIGIPFVYTYLTSVSNTIKKSKMLTDGTKKIMEAIGEYKGQVAFGVDYDFIPGDFPAPPSEKLFVKHKKPILIGQDEVKGDQPKRFYLAISVKNKKTGKIERGILSQRNYLRNLWQGQGVLGNDLYQPIDKSPSEEEKIVRAKNWNPNYVVDEIKEEYKQSPLQEFYSLNEYLRYVACGKKFAYDDSVIERITSIVNGTHELYELALPELDGPLEIG